MDGQAMIEDLVRLLDESCASGVGHVNVDFDESKPASRSVQAMGCSDCSSVPLACSVPTLMQGLDDPH